MNHQVKGDAEQTDFYDMRTNGAEYADYDAQPVFDLEARNQDRQEAQDFVVNNHNRGHEKSIDEKGGESQRVRLHSQFLLTDVS